MHKVYRIARVLKFASHQTEYFEALVLRDQSEDPDERSYHDSKLVLLREGKGMQRIRVSDPVVFSHWYVPALLIYILEIAPADAAPDLQAMADEFAVAVPELEQVLGWLKASGVLAVGSRGNLKIQADRIASTISQKRFMKTLLDECKHRVDNEYASTLSFFTADTLALSPEQFKAFVMEYKNLIEKFMTFEAPKCDKLVFQTSLQAFPAIRKRSGKTDQASLARDAHRGRSPSC